MLGERIHDRARGRWRGILSGLGLETRFMSGKHGPCPICREGTDRFRFDDKGGDGTFICSHCGAGNGVDLVMRLRAIPFIDAKHAIEGVIGVAPVIAPKAGKSDEEQRDQMAALWRRARPLDGSDIASRYLARRGITMAAWPAPLRWLDDLPYYDDAKVRTLRPAMLAKLVAPDGKSAILHRTYLEEPGVKAKVERPRMIMPGKVPSGGAVRLAAPLETTGIAEGLETALSAAVLCKVPVWAALSAASLIKWKPPAEAKSVIIFGDRDDSFAGQNAAYSLAYRLRTEKFNVEVRLPDKEEGADFNDVLQARARIAA